MDLLDNNINTEEKKGNLRIRKLVISFLTVLSIVLTVLLLLYLQPHYALGDKIVWTSQGGAKIEGIIVGVPFLANLSGYSIRLPNNQTVIVLPSETQKF